MAIDIETSPGKLLDSLTAHIDLFQERVRKLPKAATLRDIGLVFAGIIKRIYPGTMVELAAWSPTSLRWEPFVESEAQAMEHLPAMTDGGTTTLCDVLKDPNRICIVQPFIDKSLIGLVVTGVPAAAESTEVDVVCLRLFVHLFDNAYQEMLARRKERELNFTLNHRILQLNSLVDTGIEMATLREGASPHRLALSRAAALTNAAKGIVRVTHGEQVVEEYTFPQGANVSVPESAASRIATAFTFSNNTYTFELFDKESRKGILQFEDTDQLLLDALARQVHASLEIHELHQKELENQRIEQEMKVAASIQKKIIPVTLCAIPGYDIAGKNIPSKMVGGDYYDCIRLPNGTYALVVADVTGKGTPAALLVSSMHAYMSAYLEGAIPLMELLGKLNRALYIASTDDKFVTAFIALLHPETGEIEYSSAGHNPGYILRADKTVEEINIGGFPLGAFDLGMKYKSGRVTLEKDERLLLYTDGVTEAENEAGEFYDQHEPLNKFMLKHAPEKSEEFINGLIADIRKFTGAAPQNDDITALYLRRL